MVRVDSYSANFVYSGYGYEHVFGVVGIGVNTHSGYTESVLGVGTRFSVNSQPQVTAIALAKTPASRYLQLYYLPAVGAGNLRIDGAIEAYLPGDPAGVRQLAIAPISVSSKLNRRVAVGVSYSGVFVEGRPSSHAVGPKVTAYFHQVDVSLEADAGIYNAPGRSRFVFRAFY